MITEQEIDKIMAAQVSGDPGRQLYTSPDASQTVRLCAELKALLKVDEVARKIEDFKSWTVQTEDGAILVSPGFLGLLDELREVLPK